MNNEELFAIQIERLKKSPVFSMSLGSKELFHSNFWAYLMEHKDYKTFLYSLFPELSPSEPVEIKREYKHRDIVIVYRDKEFVIENKIKSYPDLDQLRKYGEDSNMAIGIVTGINKPPFKLPEKWRYVSYSAIAKMIRDVKTDDSYLKSIVLDYCDVLDCINTLMSLSLKETEGRLSYWTQSIDSLNKVRLMDVFRKLKADDFAVHCEEIKTNVETKLVGHNGWEYYLSRSYHNGKATLSYELWKYINNKYEGQIGVQIEDNQFRIFLGLSAGTSKTINDIFEAGIKLHWFDSSYSKKTNRKIFGYATSMSKNPCSYSGCWAYQYFDIWSDNGQDIRDYQKLKITIEEYLEKAIPLLDEVDKEFF